MRTLLRTVMYAVAFMAGVDVYLAGASLAGQSGLPVGWAQVVGVFLGTASALIVATVPITIYQRMMRRVAVRRRAARFAAPTEPVEVLPAATEPPSSRPRSNQTYGVTSRETVRSLGPPRTGCDRRRWSLRPVTPVQLLHRGSSI